MTVEAYAKVNLTLEVLGVREDGFHELRSVVMPVSLADVLDVSATVDGSLESDLGISGDLCLRAADVLRAHIASLRGDAAMRLGARVSVSKRIPVGGGLGGGSADAAAVMSALNSLWGACLPRERLASLGARVGSDVPALALGGAVVMEGRGERVSRLPFAVPELHFVLANPGVHSSTARVYATCRPRGDGRASATAAMVSALEAGDLDAIAAAMSNDLRPAASALHPEIGSAAAALSAAGARGVTMSGSGSTVFGLVGSESEGRDVAAKLAAAGLWAAHVRSAPVAAG